MDKLDGKLKNGERRMKSPISVPNTSQYLSGLDEQELKIVYAILEKNYQTTWQEVARKLGISRRMLYNWRQSKRIQEPVRKISRDLLISEIPDIYKALVKKARSGDCTAMKLFFEIIEKNDERMVEKDGDEHPILRKLREYTEKSNSQSYDTSGCDNLGIDKNSLLVKREKDSIR